MIQAESVEDGLIVPLFTGSAYHAPAGEEREARRQGRLSKAPVRGDGTARGVFCTPVVYPVSRWPALEPGQPGSEVRTWAWYLQALGFCLLICKKMIPSGSQCRLALTLSQPQGYIRLSVFSPPSWWVSSGYKRCWFDILIY